MANFKIYKALPLETYNQLLHANKPQTMETVTTTVTNYPLLEEAPVPSSSFLEQQKNLDDDALSQDEVVNMLPFRQQDKARKIINVSNSDKS